MTGHGHAGESPISSFRPGSWRLALAAALLVAATLAVYAPAFEFRTVKYDDPTYLGEVVQRGLTADGVRWAFTTFEAWNWHPLTWLSLMTDIELFGQDPKYVHRTNVALHVANALLLFALLGSATRAWGRSFFAAGLFALHPLHVESVAWISERKDVLSTFFGLLAIGAYGRYARIPGRGRYAAVLLPFAASLMAKPMLVTLPLLLLLLDVWPLARLPWPSNAGAAGAAPLGFGAWLRLARPKLLEKLPLLGLSLVSSALTMQAQFSAGAVGNTYPPLLRLLNAILSLVRYLKKAILPLKLAAHYPYRLPIPVDLAGACLVVLALFTAIALRVARRHPYVLVGWLWFLISLVPVIGLVQVGAQAMADRYTYVPLIGLFVAAVWGAEDLRQRLRMPPRALGALGLGILAALGVLARRQVMTWSDTRTLFQHALEAAGPSSAVYVGLAFSDLEEGRLDEALQRFRAAKQYYPPTYIPPLQEGRVAVMLGRTDEAEHAFREAIGVAPSRPEAYIELGAVYLRTGRTELALACFEQASAIAPEAPGLQNWLREARAQAAREPGATSP